MSTERNAPQTSETAQTSYDFQPPQALIDFMSHDWIDRPVRAAAHPEKQRFAERRASLSQAYRGSFVLVPAGRERVRANDTSFRFRPSSDFTYLGGIGEPGRTVNLEPDGAGHRSVFFVHDHNRGRAEFFTDRVAGELWIGPHRGVAESKTYYGADECRPSSELETYLDEICSAKHPLHVLRGHDEASTHVSKQSRGDDELSERLSEMRLIKGRVRTRRVAQGLRDFEARLRRRIRAMRTSRSERAIEAAFWARARIEANDVGYLPSPRRETTPVRCIGRATTAASTWRSAPARCGRRMRFALHRRYHAHAARFRDVFSRTTRDLRVGLGSAESRHRRRRTR